MVRRILNWTGKETEKCIKDDNVRRATVKAFGLGCIEGAIDFMAVFGTVAYTALIVKALKR